MNYNSQSELSKIYSFSVISSSLRHNTLMNNEDKELEAIAEQWVNLIFAQIEAEKQKKTKSVKVRDYSQKSN